MVQELIGRLLPHDAGPKGLAMAVCAAVVGLVLWAAGARLSRWLFTLVGVAVGAWVGMRTPRWMGWEIDSIGTAICGAFALGIAGYLLRGLWVSILLSAQLAVAGGLVAWHRASLAGATWTWPEGFWEKARALTGATAGQVSTELLASVWSSVPRVIPITMGGCVVVAGVLSAVWPRMGRVLAFGMLGSLLMGGGVLASIQLAKPEWLAKLPMSAQAQGVTLASLVVFGAAVQWALLPKEEKRRGGDKPAQPAGAPPRPLVRDLRDLNRAPATPATVAATTTAPAVAPLRMTYRLKEASR
jgi:hypothetical protein